MVHHAHPALATLADVLGLLAGLVIAFAGYRLLRSLAWLAGLLTGFVFGLVFGTAFTGVPLVGLVAGVVFGVLCALVFVFAFRLAGAVLGSFLGASLAAIFGFAGLLLVLFVVAGAIVGLVANQPLIIVATAVEGGTLAATSATSLLDLAGARFENETTVTFVLAAVLALLGAVSQWRHLRAHPG